jgi:hypothetical protein
LEEQQPQVRRDRSAKRDADQLPLRRLRESLPCSSEIVRPSHCHRAGACGSDGGNTAAANLPMALGKLIPQRLV